MSFPEGTTTHALKGTVIPKGGSDPALMAELERLKREAEKTRKAETARQIEIALLKKEAEEARLAATGLKGDKVPPRKNRTTGKRGRTAPLGFRQG